MTPTPMARAVEAMAQALCDSSSHMNTLPHAEQRPCAYHRQRAADTLRLPVWRDAALPALLGAVVKEMDPFLIPMFWRSGAAGPQLCFNGSSVEAFKEKLLANLTDAAGRLP